jgi:hypothetical protein
MRWLKQQGANEAEIVFGRWRLNTDKVNE